MKISNIDPENLNLENIDSNTVSNADSAEKEVVSSIDWRDRVGIGLSLLCLVHCIATPFLIGLIPMGAALGFWQHGFHQVFLAVVPTVALLAFIPGWKRHGDARVWYYSAAGITFMALGVAVAEVFGHASSHEAGHHHFAFSRELFYELILTVLGGACLIRAHLINRSLCAACNLAIRDPRLKTPARFGRGHNRRQRSNL